MIEIPFHPDRCLNQDRFPSRGGDVPCIICGRPTRDATLFLHIVEGGATALRPDEPLPDDEFGADMGLHPIGAACLRRHPELRPYVIRTVIQPDDGGDR